MVSVFVIVSNFLINRVGKVGPSSHSSVSIPETSAASHTDQGKEAQWINHKANKVQNIQLVELLFVIIIIIIIIIIVIIIIIYIILIVIVRVVSKLLQIPYSKWYVPLSAFFTKTCWFLLYILNWAMKNLHKVVKFCRV